MGRRYLTAVTASILLAIPMESGAAYLCWIDRVENNIDSVKVYFNPNSSLSAFLKRPTGQNDQYTVTKGKIVSPFQEIGPSGKTSNQEFDSLLLKNGDIAQIRMGAHDSCTLTVTEVTWGLGVQAEVLSVPNGVPASKAKALIRPENR